MNKSLVYILMCFAFVACVLAAEKQDFVQLVENTDYCFDCHTIYKVTKADSSNVTKLELNFIDQYGAMAFPDPEVSYLVTENYTELENVYVPCNLSYDVVDNDTGDAKTIWYEGSCMSGTKEMQKTRSYYTSNIGPTVTLYDIRDMYNKASIGETYYVKISGHLKLGEVVDNILTLNEYTYEEYALWNGSFAYRMNISCNNVSDGTPIVINGSNGFMIGGNKQIVWTKCQNNTGLAVYYNNCSSYIVGNVTTQFPFEVEFGNSSGYNPESVWDNRFSGVYHMNGPLDSTNFGTNPLIGSNVALLNDTSQCIVGKCYNFTPSTASLRNLNFTNNFGGFSQMTIECWFIGGPTINNSRIFSKRGSTDPTTSFDVWKFTNRYSIGGYIGGTWVETPVYNNFSSPSNVYMVFDYNGSRLNFYVNGALNSSVAATGTTANDTGANAMIGGVAEGSVSSEQWRGVIDECRISNISRGSLYYYQTYHNILGSASYGNLLQEESFYPIIANESSGRETILAGLDASEIADSYVAYNDKQVYERLANGSQYKGTFDFFVVNGNKRWAFNYDQNSSSSFPVFFNITPVFYVWQNYNLTNDQIMQNITYLIDNTN